MKSNLLIKAAAGSGVCLGLLLWSGAAHAGLFDVSPVVVSPGYMNGTTYGTRLVDGLGIGCNVISDPIEAGGLLGECLGHDADGDGFVCYTTDANLITAMQTLPDYGRISVYSTGLGCTSIYSYRGSRYLPPGTADGQPQVSASSGFASGSFYGARVSADTKQYIQCYIYDSSTFSYTYCQARDTANDYFYCSSDEPDMVTAARALKNFSNVYLHRNPSTGECIGIHSMAETTSLP